jgi:riboflavin synthase
MFTGLVTAVGSIRHVQPLAGDAAGRRVSVQVAPEWLHGVVLGDSICISGACMTVVELGAGEFSVDVSAESLAHTHALDNVGERVNLEQSVTLATKLGGHLVTGHVDGLGEVESFEPVGESWRLVLVVPAALARFCAYKGSLTVNGVSLTVNQVADALDASARVHINLIPHTLEHTNLQYLKAGSRVNLEVDLIARYVQRMLEAAPAA